MKNISGKISIASPDEDVENQAKLDKDSYEMSNFPFDSFKNELNL
jgi:hypothetical protein